MPSRRERFLLRIINIYPPYLGAGVRVLHRKSDDWTFRVQMRTEPVMTAEVVGEDGEVVARVTKALWVRRKDVPQGVRTGETTR